MQEAIFKHFQDQIQTTMAVGENCTQSLTDAANKLVETLLNGHRVFSCGQESTVALSKLWVSHLTGGYQIERPSFPAIDLESLSSSYGGTDCYAKSLDLHGRTGDALIIFSPGNSSAILQQALATALKKGLSTILVSAIGDSQLSQNLSQNGIEIALAEFAKPSITLASCLTIQCLCTLIDHKIFGEN
jgi:phosphoheptose isomerase